MKICFFASVKDKSVLEYNQFYAQDIRILRELSDDMVLATKVSEIPWGADLYFIWWWSWAFLPLAFAKVGRRPSIITGTFDLDDPTPGAGYRARPLHERLIMRATLAAATSNIFVSQLEYDRVPKVLRATGPRFIPHVVDGDLHPYRDGSSREPFLLTICWMHGLNPMRKGVDLAIRAHAQMLKERPELELRLAGSLGDARAGLEKMVADLGTTNRVRFVGRVDHEEKVRLMQRCEAYLQPSIFEGFGVAAAEAVACGAPVIAARGGALPEVLGDDAVWMDERSVDALVAGIRYARGSFTEERRKRAADRIRATFSYARRRDGIAEAIREAVRGNGRRP